VGLLPGTDQSLSSVAVPIVGSDRVVGSIIVEDYEKEYAFSDSDVRLLQTVAASMGVALENARLFDETQRLLKVTEDRAAELAIINSVQGGLASKLDMQAIYDLIGDKIREIFDAQSIIIIMFDHASRTRTVPYMWEKGERILTVSGQRLPFNRLAERLIATQKNLVMNHLTDELLAALEMSVPPGTQPIKSGVFVPLIAGSTVSGVISLQNLDRENAFGESDVNLLSTLASAMSVALENARLFDETQRLLKITEDRAAELGIINSVQAAPAAG
jgi:GAF domain-containing protein